MQTTSSSDQPFHHFPSLAVSLWLQYGGLLLVTGIVCFNRTTIIMNIRKCGWSRRSTNIVIHLHQVVRFRDFWPIEKLMSGLFKANVYLANSLHSTVSTYNKHVLIVLKVFIALYQRPCQCQWRIMERKFWNQALKSPSKYTAGRMTSVNMTWGYQTITLCCFTLPVQGLCSFSSCEVTYVCLHLCMVPHSCCSLPQNYACSHDGRQNHIWVGLVLLWQYIMTCWFDALLEFLSNLMIRVIIIRLWWY